MLKSEYDKELKKLVLDTVSLREIKKATEARVVILQERDRTAAETAELITLNDRCEALEKSLDLLTEKMTRLVSGVTP